MTAPSKCRVDRRIASRPRRQIPWWLGMDRWGVATKVCRIQRQSSSLDLRCPTPTLGACARGRGGTGVREEDISSLRVKKRLITHWWPGGERRIASRPWPSPTPSFSSLLATNEDSGTSPYRGAR